MGQRKDSHRNYEVIVSDGLRLRRFALTRLRLQTAVGLGGLLALAAATAVVGWSYERGRNQRMEAKVAALEQQIDQGREHNRVLAGDVRAAVERARDVGRAVGTLHLAFSSMFDSDALAEIEARDPHVQTYRLRLEELVERSAQVQNSLTRIANEMAVGGVLEAPGLAASSMREALASDKRTLAEMRQRLQNWGVDGTSVRGKAMTEAGAAIQEAMRELGELEDDLAQQITRDRESLFGGPVPIVCFIDLDRGMARLVADYMDTLRQSEQLSMEVLSAIEESYQRTGLGGGHPLLGDSPAFSEAGENMARATRGVQELADAFLSLPLGSPMDAFNVSSGYGTRPDPFTGRPRPHEGVDFAAPTGTPILAPAPGTVTHAGALGSYGIVVDVDHGDGIVSRYAHLSRASVAKGDEVGRDTKLGRVGSTGRSTGPHLHYEILVEEEPVDPKQFILAAAPSEDCDTPPTAAVDDEKERADDAHS